MKRNGNFNHYNRENNLLKKPKVEIIINQEHIYNKINILDKKINEIGLLLMNLNNKIDTLIKQEKEAPKFNYYT